MKPRKVSVFVFLCLLCISSARIRAQETPAPPAPRDPQAITLLQKAIAVMGGMGAAQIRDSVTEARVSWLQNQAEPPVTTVIKTKGPGKMRIDSETGRGTRSVIHNQGRNLRLAGNGWKVGPSANSMHKRAEHLPALLLAYELGRPDVSANYVGLEAFGTQMAHHIRLARVSAMGNALDEQFTKNSQLDVFIDPQSFLVLRIAYQHFSDIDWRVGWPVTIDYSDYRSVGGMSIPFNQRTVFNGNPSFVLNVTRVAFNQGLLDSDFEGK